MRPSVYDSVILRVSSLTHKFVQRPRVLLYKLLSTCPRVEGKGRLVQPVLLLGSGKIVIGKNVTFGYRPSPYLYSGYIHLEARKPESLILIGDRCWINNNCAFISEGAGGGIEIGAGTIIGTNVEIYDSDFHELDPSKRMTGIPKTAPVKIGANVFVGSNVRILKGVSIGDNTVIANGSIVVNSIPKDVIGGGNPARILRSVKELPI